MKVDDSENHNPGFKYASWEVKGTPIRLEIGKKDFEKNEVRCAIRHSGEKMQLSQEDIAKSVTDVLDKIHKDMYQKALDARNSHLKEVTDWAGFMTALNNKDICLAPWCDTAACEIRIKDQSKEESLANMEAANEGEVVLTGSAKTLCIPYELGN